MWFYKSMQITPSDQFDMRNSQFVHFTLNSIRMTSMSLSCWNLVRFYVDSKYLSCTTLGFRVYITFMTLSPELQLNYHP